MNIIINDAAIARLHMQVPGIAREVGRIGEVCREVLQARIDEIIREPAARPTAGLQITGEGAVIGIRDEAGARPERESISEYLDYKLGVLEPWWDDGEEAVRVRNF